MLFRIEPTGGSPLYDQIAAAVRRAISDGEVSEGDRLPATRDLAASLGVNMHTVVRAYGVLRDEGLLEVRRGRGAIVTAGSADVAGITLLVKQLTEEARRQGYGPEEIVEMIKKELS